MTIPVSRVWLEQVGATIAGEAQTVVAEEVQEPETEQKISFTLHQ
jgi:hypothetical protein